jgi:GTP 3',8-cyclase
MSAITRGPSSLATMTEPLIDSFGRVHRDLRISVTDRCNYRCTYCMPAEGLDWLPRDEVLTFEEIERIARLLVAAVRVRQHPPHRRRAHGAGRPPRLVAKLAPLGVDLSLTTNGSTLVNQARPLAEAGLTRINISLDTLRPDRFVEITRRDASTGCWPGSTPPWRLVSHR